MVERVRKTLRDLPVGESLSEIAELLNREHGVLLRELRDRLNELVNSIKGTAVIESESAIVLPDACGVFSVSGTAAITSIDGGNWAGRVITLVFQGALTFTDGENLKLAGDFVTTADDTITLRGDGTNWYEMARSVN